MTVKTKFNEGWDELLKLFLSIQDKKTLALLFDFFLTANEKESLARRFLIIKELLAAKKTQREIAHDLNVSIAKVTRGSNELKHINKKLLDLLHKQL